MAMPFSACIMIIAPQSAARLHRPQDLAVVAVEHAGVGHEQLEAGDALVLGEVLHRLQRLVVDAADDLVEGVVDGALAVGLAMPFGEPVVDVLAVALHGHVDDRRDAAPRRRARSGLERVGRERAAERQLHVGVHVDPAGDDVLAGGVDRRGRQPCSAARSARASRAATIVSPSISTSWAMTPVVEMTLPFLISVVGMRLLSGSSGRRSRRRRRGGGRGRTPSRSRTSRILSRSRSRTISSGL